MINRRIVSTASIVRRRSLRRGAFFRGTEADAQRASTGVRAQIRPVTGSPPHRQYRQHRPPQIAPTARFSEGPPKQRLNPRPADQL